MGATTSKGWEEAFDNWPGWRGNDPIRQAFQAGWDAALASHAPSEPTKCKVCGEPILNYSGRCCEAAPTPTDAMNDYCVENDCGNVAYGNSVYCWDHRVQHGLVKEIEHNDH